MGGNIQGTGSVGVMGGGGGENKLEICNDSHISNLH